MACAVTALLAALLANGAQGAPKPRKETPVFAPSLAIVPEIRTPQGDIRLYHESGEKQTLWKPGLPVFLGDRMTLRFFASTGNVTIQEVRLRLDNEPVCTLTTAPWEITVDTKDWRGGYHFFEAFVQSSGARVPLGSATLVVFTQKATATAPAPKVILSAVPQSVVEAAREIHTETAAEENEGSTTPDWRKWAPPHPGNTIASDERGIPQYRAALDARIHARGTQAEHQVKERQPVRIVQPQLFHIATGTGARCFVYALCRGEREIYRSEPLPVGTMIRLQSKQQSNGVGLYPGTLSVWVWAGDDVGNFGAPDCIQVQIETSSK